MTAKCDKCGQSFAEENLTPVGAPGDTRWLCPACVAKKGGRKR